MRKTAEVLCYSIKQCCQSTVRRHYQKWRQSEGLPDRCDNPQCQYFTEPLVWNGKKVPLILDHINGSRKDNSTGNLRFLCPICNAQLPTHGGKNRGRIQNEGEFGYEVAHRGGWRDANVYPRGVSAKLSVGQIEVNASSGERSSESVGRLPSGSP